MKDNRPLLIITARIGSHRLPGKVLKPFWKEWPLLKFLIRRLQTSNETSRIILATADTRENDPVAELGRSCDVRVVRGPEDNVLARMGLCLEGEDADFISRITADNPFTDPELLMLQLTAMKESQADYSYCKESPKGTAADIWTSECMNATLKHAATPYELEHVNAWVWDHPEKYKVLWFLPPSDYLRNELNLSIDTKEHFEIVSKYASIFQDPLKARIPDFAI